MSEPNVSPVNDQLAGVRRRKLSVRHAWITLLVTTAVIVFVTLVLVAVLLIRKDLELLTAYVAFFPAILVIEIGLLGIGGLLAVLALHRRGHQLAEQMTAIDQQTAILAEQSLARTQADTYARENSIDPREVSELLARIHEVLLLPDEERTRRYEAMMDREIAERIAGVEQFIDTLDFHNAREELKLLNERFGDDERVHAAREHLERAAEAARADNIAQVTRHVEDLMSSAKWAEAERLGVALTERYPLAKEPPALLERVRRERKHFEQTNRKRMHDEIQQFVHNRHWQDALAAARQFIQTFPTGPDTDALKVQIETLEANADIQARQSMERRLKQFIQKEQYWDALALARRIIAEFPLSPQANALRGQIPRLEDLARRQSPPANAEPS